MSVNSMFRLTEEEATELDSEDEHFYGFTNDNNHLSSNKVNVSDSEESGDEEGETSGALWDSDLQESIISFVSDTLRTRSSISQLLFLQKVTYFTLKLMKNCQKDAHVQFHALANLKQMRCLDFTLCFLKCRSVRKICCF